MFPLEGLKESEAPYRVCTRCLTLELILCSEQSILKPSLPSRPLSEIKGGRGGDTCLRNSSNTHDSITVRFNSFQHQKQHGADRDTREPASLPAKPHTCLTRRDLTTCREGCTLHPGQPPLAQGGRRLHPSPRLACGQAAWAAWGAWAARLVRGDRRVRSRGKRLQLLRARGRAVEAYLWT